MSTKKEETLDEPTSAESKLFFSGEYEECLTLIRRKLRQLQPWNRKEKANLAILGAQCLFELKKGSEMKSFLELCYESNILNIPPIVFFVWINYLYYINKFDDAISYLKQFKKVGRPMNKIENEQYYKIIIYDGYLKHRQYKNALNFLNTEYTINNKLKQTIIKDIKHKMLTDEWNDDENELDKSNNNNNLKNNINIDNIDNDINDILSDNDNETDEKIIEENTIDKKSNIEKLKIKILNIGILIKKNVNKKMIFQLFVICVILYILIQLWKSNANKKFIKMIMDDIKKIFTMGFGKSRISVD